MFSIRRPPAPQLLLPSLCIRNGKYEAVRKLFLCGFLISSCCRSNLATRLFVCAFSFLTPFYLYYFRARRSLLISLLSVWCISFTLFYLQRRMYWSISIGGTDMEQTTPLSTTMTAIVTQVQNNCLCVCDCSTNQNVLVHTPQACCFNVSDRVCIQYNGIMTLSMPPQITAICISRRSDSCC